MDWDDWCRKADELLERLEGKYKDEPKPSPEESCTRFGEKLTRIVEFLRRDATSASDCHRVEELFNRVEALSRNGSVDPDALDKIEFEYFEVWRTNRRIIRADSVVDDINLITILSSQLRLLQQRKLEGKWSEMDESTLQSVRNFHDEIKDRLREVDVLVDE